MKLTIKQFSIGIFFLLVTIMYSLFSIYYFQQRETTSKIIVESLQNDLSELSYLLSRHVQKSPIGTSRALLDRKAANSNYIKAIAVFDDQKLLITTDPSFSKVLNSLELHQQHDSTIYHTLTKHPALEKSVRYYERNKLKEYNLVFFVDQKFIQNNFTAFRKEFLLLFVLAPLLILLFIWLIIARVVSLPLEKLRQYAYYQSDLPNKFMLKELEYIRASMLQTFGRLEKEKKELYNLARTDSLSGLANRNLLEERTEQIIEQSKRYNKEFAVLFLDLDNFKSINDSLGHDIGDELLKNIAGTIKDVLRLNDVVSRIGGDEFIIVLTDYQDDIELIQIIRRIQARLMQPWQIQTFPVRVTSSIGISIYPKDGDNLLTLMKNSDIAMYQAKENGRSRYHFFTEKLNQQTQELITLTNSMQEALRKDQYELYYQPQNDIQTGKIIGAEALIRWIDPHKGMISPMTFIPIAEQNGFILELGKWVLKSAIRQKKRWEEKGIDIKLAINVAAKQIQQEGFVQHLQDLLEEHQVNHSNITLEITEYIFLNSNQNLHKTFTAIKELGIEISLDDFGTGYSSLSYLKAFPVDTLKIDKAFIDDYSSEEGAIFIETIIKMAQTLQIKVVAEGVETVEQLSHLKALNCDLFQGYLCSKPTTVREFEILYKKQISSVELSQ